MTETKEKTRGQKAAETRRRNERNHRVEELRRLGLSASERLKAGAKLIYQTLGSGYKYLDGIEYVSCDVVTWMQNEHLARHDSAVSVIADTPEAYEKREQEKKQQGERNRTERFNRWMKRIDDAIISDKNADAHHGRSTGRMDLREVLQSIVSDAHVISLTDPIRD